MKQALIALVFLGAAAAAWIALGDLSLGNNDGENGGPPDSERSIDAFRERRSQLQSELTSFEADLEKRERQLIDHRLHIEQLRNDEAEVRKTTKTLRAKLATETSRSPRDEKAVAALEQGIRKYSDRLEPLRQKRRQREEELARLDADGLAEEREALRKLQDELRLIDGRLASFRVLMDRSAASPDSDVEPAVADRAYAGLDAQFLDLAAGVEALAASRRN